MKITKATAQAAIPRAKPYELRDGDLKGFILRVQPSGVKTWIMQWARGKRQTIGHYPAVTAEMARAKAKTISAQVELKGTPDVPARSRTGTFGKFVERYEAELTSKARVATVANIKAQWMDTKRGGLDLKHRALSSISELDIARFKRSRQDAGISLVTINRDLDRLRAALNVAHKWKLLPTVPTISKLKVEGSMRVRYLNRDEEARLRAALANVNKRAKHLPPLVLLAMNTGCRIGELLTLEWTNVDLERKQIRVTSANSKSGKQRYIPLNVEARKVLEALPGRSGLVFNGLTHVKRSWAAVTKEAKLEDFHFHDLRHHFASRLVQSQVDLFTVSKLLGHSGTEMTDRYAHLSDEHLAAAVKKLKR